MIEAVMAAMQRALQAFLVVAVVVTGVLSR